MVVTGRYDNSDRQKEFKRVVRKEQERQGNYRYSSRACRKCQGLHCIYIVDETGLWWDTEWHCPSDMVHQLHKDFKIDRGCNQIRRQFEIEGRKCEYQDPVNGVACGGMTHTSVQHKEFHLMWEDKGHHHFWTPVITQGNFDDDAQRHRCMKASHKYTKATCMLPVHEDSDPPGRVPMHYSWGELLDDHNAERWAERFTLIWYLQHCFKYAKDNDEAVVHFEDYKECLVKSGKDKVADSEQAPRNRREPPRASTPAPSARKIHIDFAAEAQDCQAARHPVELEGQVCGLGPGELAG